MSHFIAQKKERKKKQTDSIVRLISADHINNSFRKSYRITKIK